MVDDRALDGLPAAGAHENAYAREATLRWTDLDLDQRRLTITQTLVAPRYTSVFSEPKTAEGRSVYLSAIDRTILLIGRGSRCRSVAVALPTTCKPNPQHTAALPIPSGRSLASGRTKRHRAAPPPSGGTGTAEPGGEQGAAL